MTKISPLTTLNFQDFVSKQILKWFFRSLFQKNKKKKISKELEKHI